MVAGDKLWSDCDMALVRAIMSTRSLPYNKSVIFMEMFMKELKWKSVEVFFLY